MAFDFNSDPTFIITVYKCHQKQQIIEDTVGWVAGRASGL